MANEQGGAVSQRYSELKLTGLQQRAIEKMEASSASQIVTRKLTAVAGEPKSRLILLEGGFHAWGGYEGAAWIATAAGCSVVASADHDPEELGRLEVKEAATPCRDFERLWDQLVRGEVWSAESHLKSTQPRPDQAPAGVERVRLTDGGTYFLTIREGRRVHVYGVYEPCRLSRFEGTGQQCALMTAVSQATKQATGIIIGPPEDEKTEESSGQE